LHDPRDLRFRSFSFSNDEDNRAVVRAVAVADLRFAGIGVHGPCDVVGKILDGVTLHP
jgi:hypothetical protein